MKEWIVTSSVLILATMILRYVLKGKISLRLQYALWVLILLRLIVPISFGESRISVMNVFPSGSHSVVIRSEPPEYIPNVTIMPSVVIEYDGNTFGSGPTATYNANLIPGTYSKKANWEGIAKIIWLIGIAIVGMCLLIFNAWFFGKLKRTRYKADISGYPLPIYKTDAVATPCMYGLLRPAIYVTPNVLGNETVLCYVLEHETTHWRHKDHIWSLLRGMCLALHWYNPLVWMAAAYSIQDAELSCDEATLQRIGEDGRTEYGRTLIGFTCSKRSAGTLLMTATTMTGSKKSIRERITLIAKKPKMAVYTLVAVLLIAAIAVGCTFTGAKDKKDKIVPLTAEEVQRYNKAFEALSFDEQGNPSVNLPSHFFTSYYDRPEDIDLDEFLRFFPSEEEVTDEAEFEALKAAENWPFGADMTMERMPVPIHKFPAETVNKVLRKYMDIKLDDLSGVDTENLIYLKEYDAYYNFTSDFAADTFYCTHGETQGDIVRLFNEFVTLTLKKRGDDYLFVSHQRVEGGADATSAAEGPSVAINVELGGNIPEAVLDYAAEFVTQQVEYYNNAGKNPPSGMGIFAITEAKITALTRINTDTASLTTDIQLWLLEYRLRPDNPRNVVLAGGMRMEDINGESWITEWGSTGQPYLVLEHNIEENTWQGICATNTDVIMMDYGTPEMLKRYGNEYTAATMELYRKFTGIRTLGQVPTIYTQKEELGHTAIRKVAELLMTELLDDLKAEQAGRTFTITDWKNLSVNVDRMYDAWVVTGEVEVRYKGILSPIGNDIVPEDEYVSVSLGERHLKNEDGVYTLSLPYGKQQVILEPPLLTPDMNVGIGVIPDYADDDILIFHGYFGLFVFDLKAEEITFAGDLKKAVGTTIIQGSEGAAVRVSVDGGTIQLFFYPEQVEPKMMYTIDPRTGSYTYGGYAPLSAYFTPADEMHSRFSHGTLGELTYTDGKNSWLLFSDWDWAI